MKMVFILAAMLLSTTILNAQNSSMALTCKAGDCNSFTVKTREGSNSNLTEVFFDVTNKTNRELAIKLFYEDKNGKWISQGYANLKPGASTTFDAYGNNPGPTKNYVIAYKNADDTKSQLPYESEIQKKYGKVSMYHSQYNQ